MQKGYLDQWYGYINANLKQYGWILLSFSLTSLKEETNRSDKLTSAQAPQLRLTWLAKPPILKIIGDSGALCVAKHFWTFSILYGKVLSVTWNKNHCLAEVAVQLIKDWDSSLCWWLFCLSIFVQYFLPFSLSPQWEGRIGTGQGLSAGHLGGAQGTLQPVACTPQSVWDRLVGVGEGKDQVRQTSIPNLGCLVLPAGC